jgi:predicted esterase
MRTVLLHGHASGPSSFDALAADLRSAGVAVDVPRGAVDLAERGGGGPFAWWDDGARPSSVGDAWARLEATLRLGDTSQRVVLVGMSQGGCLAVAGLWADPELVAGAVCVGGFAPDGFEPRVAPGAGLGRLLVVHGEGDEVVDPFLAGLLARTSRRAGIEVEERRHDGGHVWPADFGAAEILEFCRTCERVTG